MTLVSEATLLPHERTDGRTDQPLEEYISCRVTLAHSEFEHLAKNVFHDCDYLCYPHGGSNGRTEHVHVLVTEPNPGKFRKRLKDHVGGGSKVYAVKQYNNGYRGFVFYCEHEGSHPISNDLSKWIELIAEVKSIGTYKKHVKKNLEDHGIGPIGRPRDRDWQLTFSNLVPQAVIWRNKNLPGESSLKTVVQHMMKHTKWRPSKDMYKCGVKEWYQKDFEFRIGERADPCMDWWAPRDF